ncbi:LytR/AlgR family response regulator transcription factor [Aquimarina litoralis]|uniref:LytR/AlgR family response regulator transcription factor n=1 Tax=Aquimarina litoralis TaxID=584605 RepID=UPI001C56B474|nr:LytTR family DNA-binding domain-containing protein [Aquimarina litoralis]MBW1297896.1 LytTR family transcriptional regulator [Aquimarina litoralis]
MSTIKPTKNTITVWRWFQKAIVVIIFSLVVNHLAASDNFIADESYRFPLVGFLFTIILSIVVIIIADINFKVYEKKYFSKKVEFSTMARFMISTLGYISIIYIPANIIVEIVLGGEIEFYFIVIGLLITLLVCAILICLLYAQNLYDLYKVSIKDAEITIESGAKITKLTYEHIACFYSENKIVYTVQNDGTTITTDFTLNELEEKLNDQLFFRANRKIIIHKNSVAQVEKIENGKLRIRLNDFIKNNEISEINISRYKRKAFMDWFQ